jgi:translation initiation factor RLI1
VENLWESNSEDLIDCRELEEEIRSQENLFTRNSAFQCKSTMMEDNIMEEDHIIEFNDDKQRYTNLPIKYGTLLLQVKLSEIHANDLVSFTGTVCIIPKHVNKDTFFQLIITSNDGATKEEIVKISRIFSEQTKKEPILIPFSHVEVSAKQVVKPVYTVLLRSSSEGIVADGPQTFTVTRIEG